MKLSQNDLARIDAYLASHRNEIVNTLVALARIPSVKSTPAPQAPFGLPSAECLKAIAELYRQNGFETKMNAEDGYALAYYGAGERTVGVFAHADVVPVNADDWTKCAPFEPVVRDGFVFGRGCSDNKSGVMASLYAVKMLRDLELPLQTKLVFFTGSNEENGMQDIEAFVRNEPQPDVSIVPDGGYPFSYGERSIMRFYLKSKTAFTDIREIRGGSAANIVLDRVSAVLAARDGLPEALGALCEKNPRLSLATCADGGELVLTAQGIASHAAHPEGSLNAAWVLADVLKDCTALCESDRAVLARMAALLAKTDGSTLGVAFSDALGALTAANGIVRTENGKPSLSFDVRFGMSKTCDEVLRTAVHSTEADWTVKDVEMTDGFLLDKDGEVGKTLLDVYHTLAGSTEAQPFTMGGGTYARHLKNAYSVGTGAGYKWKRPTDLPDGHGGAHQADEFVCIEAFLESVKVLTCMLAELGQ